jgi:hypothetical protein
MLFRTAITSNRIITCSTLTYSLHVDQAYMRMVSGINQFPAFSNSWTNKTILDFLKTGALPVSHCTVLHTQRSKLNSQTEY